MEEEYMETQDMNDMNRGVDENEGVGDITKEYCDSSGYEETYDDEEGGGSFRGGRGRGNFRARGRGPPPGWGGPPPMRFRGRGYGPGGPPMRGRGFFRGRGGPRGFGPNNGPNFDNNWGPMGPPPPGMMGGPPPFGPPPGMMPPGGPMGPPPNMMGQPPFGGPPGMPPNMPAPELWVDTKTEDGKSYYYHSRTRETTWTRPTESPTVKIITQADMEAMTASGQMPNMGGGMPMNGLMGGPPMGGPPMGGPPMGMMPNGMMPGMMPPGVAPQTSTAGNVNVNVPSFMSQPPPWIKDNGNTGSDKVEETDNQDNDDMPPGESMHPGSAPNGGNMMPFQANSNNQQQAPAMMNSGPPSNQGGPGGQWGGSGGFPGAWGGWGGWPPPLVAQPPPNLSAANVPNAGAATQLPPTSASLSVTETITITETTPVLSPAEKKETVIPPELMARASEWTTHKAPDGRPYYYNAGKQESVWEKPKPLRELEELQAKIAIEKAEKPDKKDKMDIDESKIEVIDVEAHAEAAAAAEAARQAETERRLSAQREQERLERERADREKAEKEKVEKDKLEKEKAKQDKSRPISSTPISGTPWCVVWTGDGRVFFYNPTAHSSVWERPPQLLGRADVDKAVSQPPDALLQLQRKEAAASAKAANGTAKRVAESSSEESDTEPAKKTKQEEAKKPPQQQSKIDLGKEAAIEAEVRAARERAVVPLDQRMRSFRQMLEENEVSAFSTWEKELHKIVFDPRYLLLTSKERKQVFDKYVRERAEEERKEKKNRLQQKKTAFRVLMEEAKLHSKSSYTEFSSKHGRDERFKGIEKARDRETFFNEYIAEVRKKEKEEKEKKREQAKVDFIAMLKEKQVDRHSRWADAKKKVEGEPRYKAVESSAMKEDYYREYCKIVKEERKKEKDGREKDRERSSKKDKKDKERDKDKEKEREKEGKKEKKKEKAGDKEPEDDSKQPTPPPDQWAEILGIPEEEKARREREAALNEGKGQSESEKSTPEKEVPSPKQLRSSKKELPEKSPMKSLLKKRKEEFKSPETEKKSLKKVEKTDKRKRKKSEKE